MATKVYDIACIGAGVAGMTAAIYAGRADKTVALIDREGYGGNIAKSPKVENIPGFINVSGVDFATNMFNQITNLSTIEHFIDEVLLVEYKHGLFKISLSSKQCICSTSIIFATGTTLRTLPLETKDLYTCVLCDGPFFKNKSVMVVGSGNTGATYAIELATYCKKVYLCDITKSLCCEPTLAERITKNNKIVWLPETTIRAVSNNADGHLTELLTSTGDRIKCNAIFSAIGLCPETKIATPFVDLSEDGYKLSEDCTVSKVPGVFVAGDCRKNKVKQVVTAAADGATAAIGAIKFLNER